MLRFIQRSRALGFPVKEVAELLALWRDRSRSSAQVKELALHRIADIDTKIAELKSIRHTLTDLAARCHGDDRPDRSEEHTSELQSLMRTSYAVFCLKTKTKKM